MWGLLDGVSRELRWNLQEIPMKGVRVWSHYSYLQMSTALALGDMMPEVMGQLETGWRNVYNCSLGLGATQGVTCTHTRTHTFACRPTC